MKIANIFQNIIIVCSLLQFSNFAYATQIFTLEIDSSKSWIQDHSWVENLPDSSDAIYHEGNVFSLSGSVNVVLGRDYLNSIEIEGGNVSPYTLPSGREVILDIGSQILKDKLFPDNSFSLPEGAICGCVTNVDFSAPRISGEFDETFLSVDFSENSLKILPGNVNWIGELPSNSASNQYSFHIEASVVPVPPAFGLLLSALGFMALPRFIFKK